MARFFAAAIEDQLEWRTFGNCIEQSRIQGGRGEIKLARHQCRHGEGAVGKIFQFGVEVGLLEEFARFRDKHRTG